MTSCVAVGGASEQVRTHRLKEDVVITSRRSSWVSSESMSWLNWETNSRTFIRS